MTRVSRSITTSAGEQVRHVLTKLPRKMMNNNVLVRIYFNPTEDMVLDSGIILSGFVGVDWGDSIHMPRFGEVILIPDKLRFMTRNNIGDENLMEWGTDIEISTGDIVYFGAMISANAESFIYNNELYMLIPYSRIICKKNEDGIVPVNGYCLVREYKNETERNGIYLANKDRIDKKRGTVLFNGRNNDYYFGEDAVDANVEVGDELVFTMKMFGYIEYGVFSTIGKDVGYCQKRWIQCKV